MKRFLPLLALFLHSPAYAANNGVNLACKGLCEEQGECVQKCVAHAELFELKSDYIHLATAWSKDVDTRMKVLRSGASRNTMEICKQSGWSMDNMLTCLRSYPTPAIMKNCKKLSPLQDEQVQCMRSGKTEAEIDACTLLVPSTNHRLDCLLISVTALETRECRRPGYDSAKKMECLARAKHRQEAKSKEFEDEVRRKVAQEQKREQESRSPASRVSQIHGP